jgi:D-lyxose ketol-isomerase
VLTREQLHSARQRTLDYFQRAGIVITEQEAKEIEIADFGLNELEVSGLELITYENNERYCSKDLVLFPGQTCPQHRHPPISSDPGKMETFRCKWGRVILYVEGKPANSPKAIVPKGSEEYYTVFHEIDLHPGDQYTIAPNTWHWFQSGENGAVISEYSSTSRDELDVFLDPRIQRKPVVE